MADHATCTHPNIDAGELGNYIYSKKNNLEHSRIGWNR